MPMKTVIKHFETRRHNKWMNEIVLTFPEGEYSRVYLDSIGVGLHAVAARRLGRIVDEHHLDIDQINTMGFLGLLTYPGVGETCAIVMAHVLIDHDYDVMKWIDNEGLTVEGAMRNRKARKGRRIPGRQRRQKN